MIDVKHVVLIESERSMQKFLSTLCCQMNMECYLIDDTDNIVKEMINYDLIPDLIIINMKLSEEMINDIVRVILLKRWQCKIIGLGYHLKNNIYVQNKEIKTFNRPIFISQLATYLGQIFNTNYLVALAS
jgi:hypothetical protein